LSAKKTERAVLPKFIHFAKNYESFPHQKTVEAEGKTAHRGCSASTFLVEMWMKSGDKSPRFIVFGIYKIIYCYDKYGKKRKCCKFLKSLWKYIAFDKLQIVYFLKTI
jgi:hypothetical protein